MKDGLVFSGITLGIYAVAYLSSLYAAPIAGIFYGVGLFYVACSIITITYVIINRPYASSPLVKGVPLFATLTIPALLLMLASSHQASCLPYSAVLRAMRS